MVASEIVEKRKNLESLLKTVAKGQKRISFSQISDNNPVSEVSSNYNNRSTVDG